MRVVRLTVAVAVLVSVGALLVACGTSTQTKTPETKAAAPAEPEKKLPSPYTAKACLSRMSDQAQRWQIDAIPIKVESEVNEEASGMDGKATVWRATFASPGTRSLRTYTCSGSRLPDAAPYGITAGVESTFPPNTLVHGFPAMYLTVDSDKAFTIAQEHGGASLTKGEAKHPVYYIAALDSSGKQLQWFVSYGKSMDDTDGIGMIDASTGKYLKATGPRH